MEIVATIAVICVILLITAVAIFFAGPSILGLVFVFVDVAQYIGDACKRKTEEWREIFRAIKGGE